MKTAIAIGILIQNKSVAHYTSQKAKYGGLFLSTKIKDLSYIFSLVAKSDIVYAVNSLAERSERQLRKQLYFDLRSKLYYIYLSFTTSENITLR